MAKSDRKQQLLFRGMTNGNLSERDRLLHYSIGEFYSELSLFITECDEKNAEIEKIKNKR
jgi:hypothetical protein